ncbi:MAG: metallophosphoesterase, partial [Alistipes sp.]|nr:metallophosphoesterase [Alistipes sp.]
GYGDLTLSGHTHAMQIKLPLGKRCRGLSPARIIYPRWSGRYDQDGHTLYIGDGVGYIGYPMRIGAHPEITLITLRQCK